MRISKSFLVATILLVLTGTIAFGQETTTTVTDPVAELRDQISAASTPQDRVRLQLKLAELLVSNGRKTDAVNELHSLSTTDVFDPQGLYNAGNALARLGDTDGAITAYTKAIDQRKGRYSRALNNLGVLLLRVGRWDESQEALLSALKVEGFRYAEASYNLGRLYAARGQTDLAVREWRRALLVDPQHTLASQALNHVGTAEITVEETPRVTSSPGTSRSEVNTRPAVSSERTTTMKAAAPRTDKPLSLDPTSFGYLQKARAASDRGKTAEAIDTYRRLIARQSGYFAPANLELSYVLIGLKRNDEALPILLQVANRDGARYPISYYHLGRLYEIKGELRLAENAFVNTVTAYKTNSQFFLDLSRVREKLGDFKGALDAMEQFLTLVKKDGQDLVWSEERVAALRQKVAAQK